MTSKSAQAWGFSLSWTQAGPQRGGQTTTMAAQRPSGRAMSVADGGKLQHLEGLRAHVLRSLMLSNTPGVRPLLLIP